MNRKSQSLRPDRRNKTFGLTQKKLDIKALFQSVFDWSFNHDKRIMTAFISLLLIGVISIFSSTVVIGKSLTGNPYYFLFNHVRFILIGLLGMSLFYFVRPKVIAKFWFVFLASSIGLLLYLLILSFLGNAEEVNGAARWLRLGSFTFQPSDFAKLSFVIFIAAFLSNKKVEYQNFNHYIKQNFLPFSFWFFLVLLLIVVGNTNLGTAIVIGMIGITCYAASATTKYHKVGLLLLLGLIFIGGTGFIFYERYRMDRVAVWQNYWKTNDTKLEVCPGNQGCSDQFNLNLTALGAGGWTGVGAGQSTTKHHYFQTEAGDDSIISVIGEEWGFLSTTGILFLYLYLVLTCISISKKFSHQPVNFYMIIGCSSWIGYQAFVHVGANIGIVPLTGQTLPFISLGGSSLFCLMCAMGLILNVSKQDDDEEESFEPVQNKRKRQFKQ